MIDLSYLTEEEQGMILAVLKRDAELKKAEEKRINDLQKSVRDKARLKYLTGEWFYETKSKRHRDRIHGSDIIRASMRQKKPVTILELSQIWAERPSFVNSHNQEVFVPPELSGLLEEPQPQQSDEREENGFPSEMLAPVSQSPSKRQNPFNSSTLAAERLDGLESLLTNGAMEQAKTPDRESLPPSLNNSITHLEPAQDHSENHQVPPVPIPVPRKRTIICRSQDSLLEIDGPAARQASSYTPRGILKHSSSSSSTESLPFRLACNRQPAPQSPIGLDSTPDTMPIREPPGWLDRKQVRFCSAVGLSGIEGPPEMQDGKELGEHSLLDLDCKTHLEGDIKTGQEDRSDYNEDNDEGYPASLPKDEEEVFPSIGSPSCKEGLTQIQVTGPTNVPVDQPKHDHAEPLDPQVSVYLVADQQPGKPPSLGSGAEDDGNSVAKTCEQFSGSLIHKDKPQPQLTGTSNDKSEFFVASIINAALACHASSENVEENHSVSTRPRRGLLGIFSRGEAKENVPEDSSKSPVEKKGTLSDENFQSEDGALQPQTKLPDQPSDNSETFVTSISEAKSPSDAGINKPTHGLSPKPRRGLLGIFSRGEAKEKSPVTPSAVEKVASLLEEKERPAPISASQPLSMTALEYQHETEILRDKTVEATKDRQPEVLSRNAPQSASSVVDKAKHEVVQSDAEAEKFPPKLSKLKSFWEREYSGPKILIGKPRSDAMVYETQKISTSDRNNHDQIKSLDEDIPKTKIGEALLGLQNPSLDSDTSGVKTSEGMGSNRYPFSQQEAVTDEEKSSPPVGNRLLLNIPSADGTFLARPILICDETEGISEDLTTDSDVVTQQDDVLPSSLNLEQKGGFPELHRSLSPGQQEERTDEIKDFESFSEGENIGPRIGVGEPEEPSDRQTQPSSEKTPVHLSKSKRKQWTISQSKLGTTETLREMGDYESSRSVSSTTVSTTKERIEKGFVKQTSDKSQSRSYSSPESETECHKRPLSPTSILSKVRNPKLKGASDDELKKSPSKTCHPKALPRESTSYDESKNNGSPLKTFPIDIAPPSNDHEKKSEKPTPVVGQTKSPSHEAKQFIKPIIKLTPAHPQSRTEEQVQSSVTLPRRGSEQSSLTAVSSLQPPTRSIPLPSRRTSLGNLNLQLGGPHHRDPTARRTSEGGSPGQQLVSRDLGKQRLSDPAVTGIASRLSRSYIPQMVQRHTGALQGPPDPQFLQERKEINQNEILIAHASSLDRGYGLFSSHVDSEEALNTSVTESSPWSSINIDKSSFSGSTSKVQSRASPYSYHENPSTTRETLRPMSYSKSLDDLTSKTTFSPVPPRPPSLSDSDEMKVMSVSVPTFPQEERDGRDSDCASESSHSLGWRRKANSLSNLSLSSGMASMSSVSGSVASVYSGEHGDVEVKGTIQFALNYVQKLGEFHIFVVHCWELAAAEPKKNRSDPYVKCYLLPDKAKMGKKKSSVKKKTLNPTYNEILRFKVTMETLKTQKLNVSVWHNDNFGRNSFLGEVGLDLSEWDFNNTQINEYALKPKVPSLTSSPSHSNSIDHRGEMRVALRFLRKASYGKRSPQVESWEVQVWVKDCKNLPPVRGVIIDPFVKCTILPDSNRKSMQKTRVVKRTANPMFNQTMVYHGLRPDDLRDACVEVTVWDHDRLSNHFIGGLRIGLGSGRSYGVEVDWMDSTPEEASLWERMMESQSEWVEEVLPLRMVMMARGTSK